MITEENKLLAGWAMEFALKNGCSAVKLSLYANSDSSFELRNGVMDRLQQATENGLSLSLYVDGRFGTFSTNRLEKQELETLIKSGIEHTRYLASDPYRSLPDPERYYRGTLPDLQLFDPKLRDISPDEKVQLARAAAHEVLSAGESRVVSVDTAFGDGETSTYLLTSGGFEGEQQSTWATLSASVTIKGSGEARPQDYWYDTSLYFHRLTKEGIGRRALQRALGKIGQKKTASGRYTLVVDSMNASTLLSPVVSALYGSALQQQNSFLIDKQGQEIGSPLFTLRDEPHCPCAIGSRYFDAEGVATCPRTVFSRGVLQTYFIDTYNARKLNVAPTIGSPSRLVLAPGSKDLHGLVADTARGILVTGFNGGNCNSVTGDFSYGIEGFLIEDGHLTQPVSEMNITGNMLTLWSSLAAVGCDPQPFRTWQIPSLVFTDVSFSGM